eukprot:scaffold92907_cov63-Phaeocystis_antarctica.AAC.8
MLPSSFLTASTMVVPNTGVSRLRSIMAKASMNGSISTSTSPGAACAASLSSMLALLLLMLLPLRWWPGPRSPLGTRATARSARRAACASRHPSCSRHAYPPSRTCRWPTPWTSSLRRSSAGAGACRGSAPATRGCRPRSACCVGSTGSSRGSDRSRPTCPPCPAHAAHTGARAR